MKLFLTKAVSVRLCLRYAPHLLKGQLRGELKNHRISRGLDPGPGGRGAGIIFTKNFIFRFRVKAPLNHLRLTWLIVDGWKAVIRAFRGREYARSVGRR